MRRLTAGAAVLLITTGCALTQPATPAITTGAPTPAVSASGRRVTLEPSAAGTPSAAAAGSETPSSSASSPSGPAPTVAPKRVDAVVLPPALGEYRVQQQVENHSATYVGNRSTADLVIVTVMRGATSSAMGPTLKNAQVYGPALCGALDAEGTVGAVCALPLDQGVILVSGSGFMKVGEVAQLAGLLWEQVPS